MTVLETSRLRLRELEEGDAEFVLELVNEPAWLRFIGDKGVRTLGDARKYVREGPRTSYRKLGFGLWLVETKDARVPLGICGLIRRETLPDVDLGFAFLARHHGHGYARESARAVVGIALTKFGLARLLAITTPENERSIGLLLELGFAFERMVRLSAGEPELALYARELDVTRSTSGTLRSRGSSSSSG